jgi:di/tricarboxylate transporter
MAALTVALAKEADAAPIKLLPFATLGSFAGGLSPITPSGIVAINTATASGITGLDAPLFWLMPLTNVLYAVILYFPVFKCHRLKAVETATTSQQASIPAFSWKQWATLAGIVVTALLTAVLKVNVGLAAFAVSVVLTIIGAANEGAALKKVPWNTLIMITGVGILISLVTELGGIDLLSQALSALMGPVTATPIMTVLAGVMSWFSSASGVVMPTLIPTVPTIAAGLQCVSPLAMTVGLCVGAHLAALSPLSSCGGLMLAAYSSGDEVTAKDRNKTFLQLFAMSAGGLVFAAVLALAEGLIRGLF